MSKDLLCCFNKSCGLQLHVTLHILPRTITKIVKNQGLWCWSQELHGGFISEPKISSTFLQMWLIWDVQLLAFSFVPVQVLNQSKRIQNSSLLLLLQGTQHDENSGGTPLRANGGRVSDQWGAGGTAADDGLCDAEAPQDQLSSRAAGQIQESLPNRQQEKRGGALRRPAAGGRFLRASQPIIFLAASANRVMHRLHYSIQPPELHRWPFDQD